MSLDPLDAEFPLGDGPADTSAWVLCPYCGEPSELLLDPGGGADQSYVEDCEVCCRPWSVRVRWHGGAAAVEVQTEDDGRF
jgi:hypothetical protein